MRSTVVFICFFFFKQKTAYEMRISDWSSDVFSSDLAHNTSALIVVGIKLQECIGGCGVQHLGQAGQRNEKKRKDEQARKCKGSDAGSQQDAGKEIGRASCRERVCQ